MDKELLSQTIQQFDDIRHVENDVEFWFARELQNVLGYTKWDNFLNVIDKAMQACNNSNLTISNHFADIGKMVKTGVSTRTIQDYKLTRYACYLIAQNGDPSKSVIAFAQTYFALQTRKQELIEAHLKDLERIEARDRLKLSEKRLSQNIYERGVDNEGFGRIRSKGDKALFGGHSTQEMKSKLVIKPNRALADFLPTLTIAAKNLATEMTNYNVEEKNLYGESPIASEHIQNNSTIRNMLGERGIKPENLPPSTDIKKIERSIKSKEKKLQSSNARLKK